MMSIKLFFQILGFLLFLFGMISLVLLLVGANLTILTFIDSAGKLPGLVVRLLMVFGGVVMVYLARTNWQELNEE